MARIGLMGGTFNPIHDGHIKLAKAALTELGLDKVWFMPSKNPPHKLKSNIASDYHRVNMIKLAIDSYKEFELSDVELNRDGITYTSDTLEYLNTVYPDDEFYFILGADSLINIEKWHCPEILFKMTSFVVASRDDVDRIELDKHCRYLKDKYEDVDIRILNMEKIDVSSSNIRNLCHNRHSHSHIDRKVHQYIINNGIYINK